MAEETKKPMRRGISNETRGTSRLLFDTRDAKSNGLFIAHLDKVEVTSFVPGEDKTGMPSFNGLEVPRLVLTFASNEEELSKRRYVTLQFNAVESTALTIPGAKEEWKVNLIFDWIKHLLNVFVLKGREMTPEEETALSLDYVDFDENGDYVTVDPEEVLASWKKLFNNFEAIMNRGRKDGTPYYKSAADNKFIPLWIKLIRYMKVKNEWKAIANNEQLSFPQFVGEGCVEIYQQNVAPTIKLNATRENIAPMKLEKKKEPNANLPGAMGPVSGGIDLNAPYGGLGGGGFVPPEDDLPFGN